MAGLLGAVTICVWTGQAAAQSLDELVEEAEGFEDRVAGLEDRYLKPAILESRYKLETRFNNARVAYMLEDYDRASLLFADVIRDPRIKNFESHRAALYLLGDSLYQRRNYLSAKKYFQDLVDKGRGEYYQDAVIRLLEVAAKTGDYRGVEKLYREFDQEREMSAAVNYMRGKTLYSQGKSKKAVPFFNKATGDTAWEYRARYFKGVCLADQQKYADARDVFRQLTEDIDPGGERERNILHLSYLARGRVAYEQGKIEEAVDLYQRLPRTSKHFDRALYELTWVLVSRKNYKAASRNADIFLYLSNPDPTFIPEVKLLKADLALRLDRYDEATATYNDIISQFKPVREEMEKFMSQRKDLEGFFDELVKKELAGGDPDFLPPKVERWIDKSDEMQRVKRSIADVAKLQRDIRQTHHALQEIEARLQSGSRIKSFPQLAEGMAVGIETENQLIQLRQGLLEKEYDILKPEMTTSEREKWFVMRRELKDFQQRYAKVPKTVEEVESREENLKRQFERLRNELDTISYELQGQREQLESINTYIRENYDGELPPEKRKKVEKLREEIQNRIKKLADAEEELRREVAVSRQKFGVGDAVTAREEKMRDEYRKKLAKRREFLAQFHPRVGGKARGKLQRIEDARGALPPAHARLQGFFSKMRSLAAKKARELGETIDRERKALLERSKRISKLTRESKATASKVAYSNFIKVREKFDEIVLRGDVGLIDVAWRKKEGKTDELNQLRENRRSALKALQESFQEVR